MRTVLMTGIVSLSILLVSSDARSQTSTIKPPETFMANAQVSGQEARASAIVTIHIERYTSDADRTSISGALSSGGYAGFLPVFRKAPEVGYVEMNGRKVPVRWARQETTPKGRHISVLTDGPLFFVGGGAVDEKPRAGFDLAVIQMDVDPIGLGTGSMAAAARVKPGGPTGVQLDDYGDKPITLATVRKSYK